MLFRRLSLLITLFIFLFAFVPQSNAQEDRSTTQINAGLGLGDWGIPVYAGFDQYVHPDITVGATFSFRDYDEKWGDDYYDHSVIGIAGHGNYHFNRVLNIPYQWDLYAGLSLGFYIWDSPGNYPGDHTSGLGLGAQIGGRYFFSDRFGINLELGGGDVVSGGKFGVTVRL